MPYAPTPRQLRRRLAIIMPSFTVAFAAAWILLDHLVPPGGCTVEQMLTGDTSAMISDCTGQRMGAVALHGIAAALIALLLVAMPFKALMRRVEAKERNEDGV